MMKTIGLISEDSGNKVVALIPDNVEELALSFKVIIEQNAGWNAGFSDEMYLDAGAAEVLKRKEVLSKADIILTYSSRILFEELASKKYVIGCHPIRDKPSLLEHYKNTEISMFSLDLLPRTSIAQSMDVLTSIGSIMGYQAVISGMDALPKVVPMISSAGGTLQPAKVLVLGAGVSGLQAIANAKRMGGIVYAFDVRPQTKEQVESVGGNFIQVEGANSNSSTGGYAMQQSEEFLQKVQNRIECIIETFDLVICTAKVPGKKAPLLITKKAVSLMKPGSVIVDLAASSGGNCEILQGETVDNFNVRVLDGSDLYNIKAQSTSVLLSQNFTNFLNHFMSENENIESNEILKSTLVVSNGELKCTGSYNLKNS